MVEQYLNFQWCIQIHHIMIYSFRKILTFLQTFPKFPFEEYQCISCEILDCMIVIFVLHKNNTSESKLALGYIAGFRNIRGEW